MTEGADHKLVKRRLRKRYERRGHNVEEEYRCENGMIVDVCVEKDDETIFFEVGTLNGENRAEELLQYCDKFVHQPQFGKQDVRVKSRKYRILRSDIEILKLLASPKPLELTVSNIAHNAGYSRVHVSNRCKEMVDHGLLRRVDNGNPKYSVTALGQVVADREAHPAELQ